ncbi:YdcF family protein [Companilactobacillus jidongensis]|uniref:YdcF family protein n=1 Tax=Companilactobacillus jidongensis TaxID=2486006 RepID=UPI000F7A28F1|nr:YdcF family protein [Companilactobacillus jidongensis]
MEYVLLAIVAGMIELFLIFRTRYMFSRHPVMTTSAILTLLALLFVHIISSNAPTVIQFYVIVLFSVDLVLMMILLGYVFYMYYFLKKAKVQDADYLLVLGTSFMTKRVPPVMQDRLDATIDAFHRLHDKPKIIVSGGQSSKLPMTEASLMKKYLLDHGIPESQIILEGKSLNTMQNLEYSSIVLKKNWHAASVPRVMIITSEFHIPRTLRYLKNLGISVSYLPARTMPIFLKPAMFREFTAIVWYYKYTVISVVFIIVVLLLSSIQ